MPDILVWFFLPLDPLGPFVPFPLSLSVGVRMDGLPPFGDEVGDLIRHSLTLGLPFDLPLPGFSLNGGLTCERR